MTKEYICSNPVRGCLHEQTKYITDNATELKNRKRKIEHLRMLAESDFDAACIWAENNIDSLKTFFSTWAPHCGASRSTFVGHTVRMLINLDT